MNAKQHVFLTGAGFTHNFGAPLATDIWSTTLSHPKVQAIPRVREALLRDSNFEDVYDLITTGDYSSEEKEAIKEAVTFAYAHVDDSVRSYSFAPGSPYPVNIYAVQKFINMFSGSKGQPGFFFTLNQDLFVERHYYNGTPPSMPGIASNRGFSSLFAHAKLAQSDKVTLPSSDQLAGLESEMSRETFFYLKLHGSSNWYSADGQQRMVIGCRKSGRIDGEPLLAKYFDIFKRVLLTPARRLLSLGYGFGDEHVNDVIADAIKQGLQLHILSPSLQSSTKERICKSHRGGEIWKGLFGYYRHTLLELFPQDQSTTAAWNSLKTGFFGVNS